LDLSPVGQYLDPGVAVDALVRWATNKFGIEVVAAEFTEEGQTLRNPPGRAHGQDRGAYKRREIEYRLEYALDMTVGVAGTDNVYALTALVDWANRKYEAGLTVEDFRDKKIPEIHKQLIELSELWMSGDRLEKAIHAALGTAPTAQAAVEFARPRFDTEITEGQFDGDMSGRWFTPAGSSSVAR